MIGSEKREIYDLAPQNYVECYEISKTNLEQKIFEMQANYRNMAQWVKDTRIFQQKACRWRHPHEIVQIDRIIFDDSGLFAKHPFSEYYIDLNNLKGHGPLKTSPTPLMSKMKKTLIVSIQGRSLADDSLGTEATTKLMKAIIEPLAINYRIRGNGDLPVYLVYGNDDFNNALPKAELVNHVFNKMWIFSLAPANIMWIGNGIGISEIAACEQKAYMEMTYEMTKSQPSQMEI